MARILLPVHSRQPTHLLIYQSLRFPLTALLLMLIRPPRDTRRVMSAVRSAFPPKRRRRLTQSLTGKRKLKCSGEPSGCDRCIKLKLTCHFSAQKQMGRPRKRQKANNDPVNDEIPAESTGADSRKPARRPSPPSPQPALDPNLTEKETERTNFQNICNAAIAQTVKRSARKAQAVEDRRGPPEFVCGGPGLESTSSTNTSPYDAPRTPPEGAEVLGTCSISQWPDFTDMTMLPLVVQDRNEREKPFHVRDNGSMANPNFSDTTRSTPYSSYLSGMGADPGTLGQLPTVPACPCLPNLYLTLSTLSALSAFPVSSGMIDTLLNAQRTGRSVIYCPVCPQNMDSGSQNVFMSTMLVIVLADHWHRVKKAGARLRVRRVRRIDECPRRPRMAHVWLPPAPRIRLRRPRHSRSSQLNHIDLETKASSYTHPHCIRGQRHLHNIHSRRPCQRS